MFTDKEIKTRYSKLIKEYNEDPHWYKLCSLDRFIRLKYEHTLSSLDFEVWQYCQQDY